MFRNQKLKNAPKIHYHQQSCSLLEQSRGSLPLGFLPAAVVAMPQRFFARLELLLHTRMYHGHCRCPVKLTLFCVILPEHFDCFVLSQRFLLLTIFGYLMLRVRLTRHLPGGCRRLNANRTLHNIAKRLIRSLQFAPAFGLCSHICYYNSEGGR